jgi:hypothetical protein
MRTVKMVVKDEPDSWFKPGTEVWDENTGARFTEEEYNDWIGSGNIVVRGIRVSEADGTEYKDSELCGFDEFDITFIDALEPCPFCGSDELSMVMCEVECCGGQPRSVECICGCELYGTWKTEEDAITAWNTRSGKSKGWWPKNDK